ncbi:anti-sigma factor family protein [Undibacterium sp. SXout7W]|uniref:anti-sigma factor family protein n=1 Tax=Undibacterium sp. SXout7W TaxID=3413049 RepID=UPI003BF3EC3E
MTLPSFSESDLHAYVDKRLSPERSQELERWLEEHPHEQQRVRTYQAQAEGLHQLFDAVLDEPVPAALQQVCLAKTTGTQNTHQHRSVLWSWQGIAAGLMFAVLFSAGGGIVGWNWHEHRTVLAAQEQQRRSDNSNDSLPHRAAIAHVVYTPDVRRPVEVSSDQEEQLVKWLSKRLGSSLKPPKLSSKGFDLVGGRLLPGTTGPVAQFMYQNAAGLRLTLYASNENKHHKDTGFRYMKEGQVSVFYWIDGEFGYALSGNIDKAELSQLSLLVFDQLQTPHPIPASR